MTTRAQLMDLLQSSGHAGSEVVIKVGNNGAIGTELTASMTDGKIVLGWRTVNTLPWMPGSVGQSAELEPHSELQEHLRSLQTTVDMLQRSIEMIRTMAGMKVQ